MPVKTKKTKRGKIRSDVAKITMCLPLDSYVKVKKFADDEIRTVSQQARYFMEIGMEIVAEQQKSMEMEMVEERDEIEERQPAIGFMVNRDEERDDE